MDLDGVGDAGAPARAPSTDLPADGLCPRLYLPADEDGDGVAGSWMWVWDGGG